MLSVDIAKGSHVPHNQDSKNPKLTSPTNTATDLGSSSSDMSTSSEEDHGVTSLPSGDPPNPSRALARKVTFAIEGAKPPSSVEDHMFPHHSAMQPIKPESRQILENKALPSGIPSLG